jgi:hypothetical protein
MSSLYLSHGTIVDTICSHIIACHFSRKSFELEALLELKVGLLRASGQVALASYVKFTRLNKWSGHRPVGELFTSWTNPAIWTLPTPIPWHLCRIVASEEAGSWF